MNVEIRDNHYLVFLCQNNVTFKIQKMKILDNSAGICVSGSGSGTSVVYRAMIGPFVYCRMRIWFICELRIRTRSIHFLPYPDLVHLGIAYPKSGPGPFVSCSIRGSLVNCASPHPDPVNSFLASSEYGSFVAVSGSGPLIYSRIRVRFIRLLPYKPPVRAYPDKVHIRLWLIFASLSSVCK